MRRWFPGKRCPNYQSTFCYTDIHTYIHTYTRAELYLLRQKTFHILNLRYYRYYMRQPLQFQSLILPLKRPRDAKASVWFSILFHSWFLPKAFESSQFAQSITYAFLTKHSELSIFWQGRKVNKHHKISTNSVNSFRAQKF